MVEDRTIMEAAILPHSRRQGSRNAYRNNLQIALLKKKKPVKDGTRKRIKRIEHSSSSEDEPDVNNKTGEKSLCILL